MCKLCKHYPCHHMCPNYEPPKANEYCSVCGFGIYENQEYIENDSGDCAHWDCIDYARDLLDWLGYEIKTMEEDY